MTDEEWREFLEDCPPHVRAVAEQWPIQLCYRSTLDPAFHYMIHTYDALRSGGSVTISVLHGSDSARPGIAVYGQEPETLIRCGCGKWTPATPQQLRASHRQMLAEHGTREH